MKTDNKVKWRQLSYNGPSFPQIYQLKGYEIPINMPWFDDKPIKVKFPSNIEEMLYHWASKTNTQYVKDPVFRDNFFKDLKAAVQTVFISMLHEAMKAKFPDDWDFSVIVSAIEKKKEARKNRTKEEKEKAKLETAARKEKYGYAMMDGHRIEIMNYTVEPPGIFMGRGKNPLRGRWKSRIYPNDVTLNLSKDAPIPVPDVPEYISTKWKNIVNKQDAMWPAFWLDKLTGNYKYVMPSPKSYIRQQKDIEKFEKAMRLIKKMPEAIEFISKRMQTKFDREPATVCSLIAHMGLRVGDEKDIDSEAETYGATTLLKKHIQIKENFVYFNFIGKDSILYKEKVELPDLTVKNLKSIIKFKKPNEQVFNVTSNDINELLGKFMPGLTAKVFRTAIATAIMENYLKQHKIKNASTLEKIKVFKEANILVAQKLNHRKTPTESAINSISNKENKLAEINKILKTMKKTGKIEIVRALKEKRKKVAGYKKKYKNSRLRNAISRANSSYGAKKRKWKNRIKKLEDRKNKLDFQLDLQKKTLDLNLGTSLTSYVNPRVTFGWAKSINLELRHIYTKANIERFGWAQKKHNVL